MYVNNNLPLFITILWGHITNCLWPHMACKLQVGHTCSNGKIKYMFNKQINDKPMHSYRLYFL